MNLNREVFLCIYEFDENGQLGLAGIAGPEVFWILTDHVFQFSAIVLAAHYIAGAVRMGGAFPGFGQRVHVDILFKLCIQSLTAPEGFSPRGSQ
ncbi:hypothetical protein SDC9_158897 [bioreactor metagenome]|uniref:Uncharacterized protein n=1 Tax=bioreactor metagenome TaxID=1076179 RepID=A0A645FGH5_9ZZZZ